MAALAILAVLLLLKHVKAEAPPPLQSNRTCVEFMLPVSVTAQNAVYDVLRVDNNTEAAQFAIDQDTWDIPNDQVIQNMTVSDTFDISAQLCIPQTGAKKTHLQIATHGLVFDKRYWDVPIKASEYSYVDAALQAGYSILTYDRLGTGLSDKPDAYTVVQAPLELEILRNITEQSRSGSLLQQAAAAASIAFPNSTTTSFPFSSSLTFDKIIHVGHSFGSFLTDALLIKYPNLTDAAVITGFILNSQLANMTITSADVTYAAENDPISFSDRGSGYIVPATASALQATFFSTRANSTTGIGGFEPKLLEHAFETRQPLTVGEWISGGPLNLGAPAPNFTGPVQFVVAEYDFLVCRGDCKGTFSEDTLGLLYPAAKDVNVHIQEGTGHGLTMHKGAKAGYQVTLNWLDSNGL
ncbi:hypothetical protein MMC10_002672 [Thelotrema lepadinum]|nr:hypothetical protein [Thelotrema lepadinum]